MDEQGAGDGDGGPGEAGPLGDEAMRLISAVQDWARRSFPDSAAGHSPECQWCPLCQFVAVLRGDRPDVTERVAEAGTAVVSALRALVDAATSGAGASGAGAPGPGAGAEPEPRVHKIDLGELDLDDVDPTGDR